MAYVPLFLCLFVVCVVALNYKCKEIKKKKNTILIITCHNKEENEAIGFQ